jgi:glycosyltransferase involved in cell wall biosynthesis
VRPLASAGSNRNAGTLIATSDYVVFMDGDDRFVRSRNERLSELQMEHNFDLLIHAAYNFQSPSEILESTLKLSTGNLEAPRIWKTPALFETTFPNGSRDRALEMGGANTNIILGDLHGRLAIHHGHSVVRRACLEEIRFHELYFPRNEDGVFVRDMLFQNRNVLVTEEILSAYRTYSSASSWRSKMIFNLLTPALSKIRSLLSK